MWQEPFALLKYYLRLKKTSLTLGYRSRYANLASKFNLIFLIDFPVNLGPQLVNCWDLFIWVTVNRFFRLNNRIREEAAGLVSIYSSTHQRKLIDEFVCLFVFVYKSGSIYILRFICLNCILLDYVSIVRGKA